MALAAIGGAFLGALLGGPQATVLVLILLVFAGMLFVGSVMVYRAGDAKRRSMERD